MKQAFVFLLFVSLINTFVIGQPSHSKSSSSMKAYKHPLIKAATKEKEISLGRSSQFKAVIVKSDAGFKHPYNKVATIEYLVPTKKATKKSGGDKHPLGL